MFDFADHAAAPRLPAVVSRTPVADGDEYLVVKDDGRLEWTRDPKVATPFPSMKDATRMAFRLPASLRAFSLLRDVEIHAH